MFEIYYDDFQEGTWFQSLSRRFDAAPLKPITGEGEIMPCLSEVLAYDRPDIIIVENNLPILMVERTAEVPSGHNVGQRFARLAAAAQCRVPAVYFFPYAARKHGGDTEGPRYANLRLFYAIDAMARTERTAVLTINWPVDHDFEVIKEPSKDARLRDYLNTFFVMYDRGGTTQVNRRLMNSEFLAEQLRERDEFIRSKVRRADQYDRPPDSVTISRTDQVPAFEPFPKSARLRQRDTVLYRVGMTYIRSDPYCGMGMLYEYLYAGRAATRTKNFVFHFPNIQVAQWRTAATSGRSRKDIRLYKHVADAILFSDDLLLAEEL